MHAFASLTVPSRQSKCRFGSRRRYRLCSRNSHQQAIGNDSAVAEISKADQQRISDLLAARDYQHALMGSHVFLQNHPAAQLGNAAGAKPHGQRFAWEIVQSRENFRMEAPGPAA